ncbi:hypothetical protein AB835_13320 [Candidatus Endobugula sertula]|uniref:YbgF trimerisation domain-containing protein n=1 Tax=Candidatus Endobugula sertula TaxID=62101 RepID=A0A1D2QLZ0_9GAMM|nr:hypothetical protein AB835_13320 [Candidatus Endobugula sertula]
MYRFSFSFVCCLLLSGFVYSQAQVRDPVASAPATIPPESSATANLVYDLQALQQEVLALRGQLEQQAHEIKRLKQQRLDDYLDLDKRLSDIIRDQSKQPITTDAVRVPPASLTVPSTTTGIPQLTLPTFPSNGDELYNTAINMLLNQQNYAGAQEKFTEYLKAYPEGRYVPNVYYWQGQILFAGAKKQQAADIFSLLITKYPTHPKTSDAKFKLAKIYFNQGKKDEAKAMLTEVAASNTDAALLAKSFLNKNY